MSGWRLFRLGDLVDDIAYGTSVKCSESPVGVPVLRMGNVRYDGELELDDLKYAELDATDLARFGLERGDIVFNRTNSKELVGKTGLWDGRCEAAAASYFIRVRVNRSLVIPEWIWRFMNSPAMKGRLFRTARGAIGQANINSEELRAFIVPVPPLDEQQRMAGLLDKASDIRRRASVARAKANAIRTSLFLDMFGDPAANPKGWPLVSLGEVATVGSGAGFPKNKQGRQDGQYPFLKVSDMNLPGNEVRITSWNNTVTEVERRGLRATAFPAGSIIFPKIGAAIATNKKRILTIPSCLDNNVMAVTFGQAVNMEFGLALFRSKNISDFASDSNPPSMRKATVEQWSIPLPPQPLQTSFADKVRRLEAAARALDAARHKADAVQCALSLSVFDVPASHHGSSSLELALVE